MWDPALTVLEEKKLAIRVPEINVINVIDKYNTKGNRGVYPLGVLRVDEVCCVLVVGDVKSFTHKTNQINHH